MQNTTFEEVVERIIQEDPRYHPDAYEFLREALDFTQHRLSTRGAESQRHVTGQELLEGIRLFALREFGPMAKTVLNAWGVTQCADFGEIVFNLVDRELLRTTETDRREDFHGGYDFDEAFVKPFLPRSRPAENPPAALEAHS
jgi:uncharacterized repeat protein (TIGR04138 family)